MSDRLHVNDRVVLLEDLSVRHRILPKLAVRAGATGTVVRAPGWFFGLTADVQFDSGRVVTVAPDQVKVLEFAAVGRH